jgi:hypothetical protein
MVIISPYAKPAYTDTNWTIGSLGVLAFIERNWSLPAIGIEGGYYDYASSFDFTQVPLGPIALRQHPLPAESLAAIARSPIPDDDPT